MGGLGGDVGICGEGVELVEDVKEGWCEWWGWFVLGNGTCTGVDVGAAFRGC